jgi:Fe-S oxidoreductase
MEVQQLAHKYELYGCVQCGKCTGSCPVSLKSDLQIRRLVYDAISGYGNKFVSERKGIWDCTTCGNCELRCPKSTKPVDFICELRSYVIEKGKVPATLRAALESVLKHKNPWNKPAIKRTDWAKEINIKRFDNNDKSDMLLYTGCTPSYDPRCQKIPVALVKIFNNMNIDFGVLGNEECCCGNEMKKMGEFGLFEYLAEENISMFKKYGIKKIVTISPHCYNTFKNDYQEFDMEFEVEHYTEYLSKLAETGKLRLNKSDPSRVVVYHDPCYLGKRNKIFDAPRKLLSNIKGIELKEFDRAKERSVCCEGGGGKMWLESAPGVERLSEQRVKEAVELGADIIATSCPFCLLTLEDAVKTTNNEEKIMVADVAELL